MKILVTGSSGLIGSALVDFLKRYKHDVWKLVRVRTNLKPHEIAWSPKKGVISPELLEGFDVVIHLAGESLIGRWTDEKKKKIEESRVKATKVLCKNLSELKNPPKVLISGSAIGFYGSQGEKSLDEGSAAGTGFLSEVCQKWEKATQAAVDKGIRTVNLRTGMVLSKNGGALKQMLMPFKLCLGATIGRGNQYMSWIDIDDLIGIIYYCIKQSDLQGPVNAVSPYPVTNEEFTKTLGLVLNRPTFLVVPETIVKWVFGELGENMLLSSTRVRPELLLERGYTFEYPKLAMSLEHLLVTGVNK